MVFAVAADLASDRKTGIPSDHAGTFSQLAGQPFGSVMSSSPGVARCVTNLEIGYALHELTFAVLVLVLVLVPLRPGRAWAWLASWAVMIANVGYTATFGACDSTILGRSLAADIAVPVFLLMCAPAVFDRRAAVGSGTPSPVGVG
jgi:hypothetical protein